MKAIKHRLKADRRVGLARFARSRKIATTPAMKPLTANAAAITMFAFTPTRRVIVKSSAAARSARPMTVRRKKMVSSDQCEDADNERDQIGRA